jgi:hypothetical protein
MSEEQVTWETFRPRWAPNVRGEHTVRGPSQVWKVTCETCGETFGPLRCDSGMVRNHIAKFAVAHVHKDPLAPPKK